MLATSELILHMILTVFNIFPLIYHHFKDSFSLKKEKLFIFFTVLVLLRALTFLLLYTNANFNLKNIQYLRLVLNIIIILLIYWLDKRDFYKLLFIYLLEYQYSTFVFGSTFIICNIVEINYNLPHKHLWFGLILLTHIIIISPALIKFIKNKIIPALTINNYRLFFHNCIIQITLISFELLIGSGVSFSIYTSIKYILTRLCIFIIYYYTYSILFDTIKEINNKLKLEKESLYISNQLNLQRKQYSELSEYIKEIKKSRHDLRHHITLIEAYLSNNDTENLEKYINEYKLTLPKDKYLCSEQNFALNTILHHYISVAKSNNIIMDVKFDFNNKIFIQDTDLCIIFGNCIENAIEACKKLDSLERRISIRTKMHNNMIVITIDNTFNGELKKHDDIYLSSKRSYSSGGIGMVSVKEVIKKYNGYVKFESTDNVFKVSAIINPNSIT